MNFDEDTYTSHYDPGVNVCYVRINLIGTSIISSAVYDAFQGRVYAYAVFSWSDPQSKKKEWEVGTPSVCHIDIPGKPEIECHSINEFDQLTEKYFGTAK